MIGLSSGILDIFGSIPGAFLDSCWTSSAAFLVFFLDC